MTDAFFGGNAVRTVNLADWMKWASGQADAERHVVLPMIQRGSVWAPHKLLDLWDTLLRGMPLGALMASETMGGSIKVLGEAGTRQAMAGDLSLVDGQQRTLSMLAGWPQGLANPLRPVAIWVELDRRRSRGIPVPSVGNHQSSAIWLYPRKHGGAAAEQAGTPEVALGESGMGKT